MRRQLVIFVKEPVAGRVKSRLGREIGMVSAAWWYRHQARRLARRLSADPRWRTILALSPDRAVYDSRFWPRGALRIGQGRGDLGARMGRMFRGAGPGPMIIVGSDIPDVTPARIWSGFQALGRAEAAVGPAEDGGYWLIGLANPRRAPRRLFDGVRWSSASARADTEATLSPLSLAHLETLQDVDDAADLARHSARAPLGAAL